PHRREKAVLAGGKFVPLVPLHPKRLHDAYALQGLVQERVEGAELGLPPRGDLLQPPGEPADGKDRERNGDERQQRQPPVESDGDAEQDQNLKTIAQVRGEAVGDGELHRRHVACEAREESTTIEGIAAASRLRCGRTAARRRRYSLTRATCSMRLLLIRHARRCWSERGACCSDGEASRRCCSCSSHCRCSGTAVDPPHRSGRLRGSFFALVGRRFARGCSARSRTVLRDRTKS